MPILKVANVHHDAAGFTRTQVATANTIQWYTGNAEGMRLDPSGNVGIGTTTPAYKLQIVTTGASSTETALDLNNPYTSGTLTSNSALLFSYHSFPNYRQSAKIQAGQKENGNFTTGCLDFFVEIGDVLPASPNMRIDATGNVTIGRISSTAGGGTLLDVAGAVNASSFLVNGTSISNAVQNNVTTLITTGYTVGSFNAGLNVASYGTWTPNPANGNYQYANSNGSFTLAAPTTNCAIDILLTNGTGSAPASNGAKAITFSGYNVQSGGAGDAYDTVANSKFLISIRRINGLSTYIIKALQ